MSLPLVNTAGSDTNTPFSQDLLTDPNNATNVEIESPYEEIVSENTTESNSPHSTSCPSDYSELIAETHFHTNRSNSTMIAYVGLRGHIQSVPPIGFNEGSAEAEIDLHQYTELTNSCSDSNVVIAASTYQKLNQSTRQAPLHPKTTAYCSLSFHISPRH